MSLSKNVISQFVKNVKTDTKSTKKETFIQGMIVLHDGKYYVKLHDGSERLMPAAITTNVKKDEPVTVMIKNHTATVMGNATNTQYDASDGDVINNTLTESYVQNLIIENVTSIPDSDINALWTE